MGRSIKSTTYIDAKGETRHQYALDFRTTMRELGKQIGGFCKKFGNKSFYGILAVVDATEQLITQTLNQGIYYAEIHDNIFEFKTPPNFKLRAF